MLHGIIFDFDGVLVESVSIKGDAFVALYENESAEIQQQVLEYHNHNGGISRYDKIKYFEQNLLQRSPRQDEVNILADKFGELVEQKVISTPWVIGALEFLEKYYTHIPLYVASATPQDELRRIIEARGANKYFAEILGAPVKKDEHIANVMRMNGWRVDEVVMIGDATTDFEAAEKNKVPFVGRVPAGEESPFPSSIVIIPDLTSLARELGLE